MIRPPVTAKLSDFVVVARFEALPPAVRREAARTPRQLGRRLRRRRIP